MELSLYTLLNLDAAFVTILSATLLLATFGNVTHSRHTQYRSSSKRKTASDSCQHRRLPQAQHSPKPIVQAPSEYVVLQAERVNRENGHENLGPLSFEAGFVPVKGPIFALPKYYAPWDDLIAKLPELINTQNVQGAIDQLPCLEAHHLPDQYLQRAASIIGILSHAYVRLDGQLPLRNKVKSHSEILPASLYIPWTRICERLGRSTTSLTFTDLVLYNFTTSAARREDMTIENTKLLFPTVDNVEEHTFYGVMIEVNAKAVYVVRDVVQAHKAVLMDDGEELQRVLGRLVSHVRRVMRSLGKLNARRTNPVVWTKTVANLAIPWVEGLTGAAGTAHPFFHLMDQFTERHSTDTRVGKEAIEVRSHFPKHWQEFISAVREVSVSRYVSRRNNRELSEVWQALQRIYAGDNGLLGFHRRKVYGFLAISFRIGRNSTINGLGAQTPHESCKHVDEELEQSRVERSSSGQRDSHAKQGELVRLPQYRERTRVRVHELIQHNNPSRGCWFVANGKVYDATPFMKSHPGGEHVISILSGQDATRDLKAVAHLTNPAITKILDRYEIGTLQCQQFSCSAIHEIYDACIRLAYKISEIEAVYHKTTSFLSCQMTSADRPQELSALKSRHLVELMSQLRGCYATSLCESLETLNDLVANQDIQTHVQSDIKATVAEIKSRPNTPQSLLVNSESDQPAVLWDVATERLKQNTEKLSDIKTTITNILMAFEGLDAESEYLNEEMWLSLADGMSAITRWTEQLG